MLKKARRQGKNRQKNLKKRQKNSAISAPIWYNVNNDKNIKKERIALQKVIQSQIKCGAK